MGFGITWFHQFSVFDFAEKREDISRVDSDKFDSIINEVESLHQLGTLEIALSF